MYLKLFGITLLIISLITAGIIGAKVEVPHRVEVFAKTDDNVELKDAVVAVPPWNSTEGWVGFNVTLPNRWKPGYEAYGMILPNDGDKEPKMVMRVVNITGLLMLKSEGFDIYTWNSTEIYAAAYLSKDQLASEFKFLKIDNSSKYVFLFRGLKNETAPRPILINMKEAWYEYTCLLEPTPVNLILIGVTASLGLIFTVIDRHPRRSKVTTSRRRHKITRFRFCSFFSSPNFVNNLQFSLFPELG